ncbi:type IV pilus secretin PilQ, partial [Acinetobacter baumannii]|nr:type IV pilus secretin PilQ [Acinetobacter baumannii]MCW1649815.1 type IV pilus secretin PilQ [Acinetobacter baumannii]
SKGLAQRRDGNVILVAPLAEITRNEALEATAYSQSMTLSPLVTKVVQLNYANAKNVADMLRPTRSGMDGGALNQIRMANADESTTSLLSSRGSVSIDERTNTIAITDTNEKINVIKSLVEQIDVPVRQVMIEARIVRASTNFSKAIGVK